MWWMVVMFVASLVIGYFLRPKTQYTAPKPAGFDEVRAPTATAGREIPVVFGTCWVSDPNVVWFGDFRTEEITQESGGKK